jgi:hypothetical protein
MHVLTNDLHAIPHQEACHGSAAQKWGGQGVDVIRQGPTDEPNSAIARHIFVSAKSNGPRVVVAREWSQ